MSKVLMQIVVDCAVFLELSDESQVNPDAAVQQLEQIAWMLRTLSPAEQAELVKHITAMATEAEREAGRDRRWQCLLDLPQALGLTTLEG